MRQALLDWYDATARDLPWRRTRDPYAIWVSEIMLQQTRVDTVIPYYERFLSRFPTAEVLAGATEDDVLSLWSGLGYYRRARLLHKGVREVVAQYGGTVPRDAEARLGLPGVGRYTAGAIGSIAFDEQEPVVDGNVSRVLARIFGIETALGTAATTRRLWSEAGALVRGERPGALNQALMELGATVCTPTKPDCGACPIQEACDAHANGDPQRLPVPRARKAPQDLALTAVVATTGRGAHRRILLVKSDQPLFGGLWGVPMIASEGAGDRQDARRALRGAGATGRVKGEPRATIQHVLTHRRLRVTVFDASGTKAAEDTTRRFFALGQLGEVGISRLTTKIL